MLVRGHPSWKLKRMLLNDSEGSGCACAHTSQITEEHGNFSAWCCVAPSKSLPGGNVIQEFMQQGRRAGDERKRRSEEA